MSDPCMACITIAPAFEHMLVDWLLDDTPSRGFTCVSVYGHSATTERMNTAEKIAGRVKRVQIQVLCENRSETSELLERLTAAFPNMDVRYWIYAVLEQGRLGSEE